MGGGGGRGEKVNCTCLQRVRNVCLRECHAIHARRMTFTGSQNFFLRARFFPPQEGANQVVPETLMDMAMKVRKPLTIFEYFHSKSLHL